MADDLRTLAEFYSELNKDIRDAGGVSAFARCCDLPVQIVANIQSARRMGNATSLAAMGWQTVARFQRIARDATAGADHPWLSLREFYSELNSAVRNAGGLTDYARGHLISPQAVSNIQSGARNGSDASLALMGWRRVYRYRRIAREQSV
ncbi:hypothetical protein HLH33_13005 [Gluconacetobacter diazotrophicus]|uniref:Uncharacterized protein n=1 Tax=Gluconacetobacter diazotrophicus TaxID=33996 RepID=A0A7W4I6K2_GLUDI|nr:hypothetical protein [Gluconacetobacter diazotrophicus]MBB2157218.1 hypothetical protein [Gluconacetobacter diazotrophicus]